MNDTVKEILGILDAGRPDLQVAAAQILGELRIKDPAVVRSLSAAGSRSPVLGRYVLEALSRIATPDALRVVVRIMLENDSLVDQASHLLAEAGHAAHPAMAEVFPEAAADRRLRLLTVLGRAPSKEAIRPFVMGLVAGETCDAAAKILGGAVANLAPPIAKLLREALVEALAQPLAETSVASVLSLIAAIDPAAARAQLLHYADGQFPAAVRNAALRALVGQKLTATQARAFLTQLEDPAQAAVHDVLRELLAALPEWPEGLAAQLKKMLTARNPEQRLFALRALRTAGSADLIKVALKLRDHDDARFRAAAEDILATSKHAIEPLLRLLQLAKEPAEADRISKLLDRQGAQMQPKQHKALAERAIKLLPVKPMVADAMIGIVLAAAGPKLAPFFVERALRWRRTRRFAEALHVLAKLAGAQLLDNEGRYQLAVTRLLQDAGRPGAEGATPGNAAMGFFTVLLRDGFPLFDRLKKESTLPPDQQLKLATYFAEMVGPERRFGQELLQHLAARHKGRTGDEARHALRAVGY